MWHYQMARSGPSPSTPIHRAPGGSNQATLTPAEAVFVAYDIPPISRTKRHCGISARPTCVACPTTAAAATSSKPARNWHDHFAALLKATPKWRDPAAAKERSLAAVVMKKVDDEYILEWRSIGLSFKPLRSRDWIAHEPRCGSRRGCPRQPGRLGRHSPRRCPNRRRQFQRWHHAGSPISPQGTGRRPAVEESSPRHVCPRDSFRRRSTIVADFTLGPEDLGAKPAEPQPSKASAGIEASPRWNQQSQLSYEGKSFDDWRKSWRTELSLEKRTDAVKALAAFGSHGFGPEASEAILDVAQEYDSLEYGDNPEGKFGNARAR